MAYLITKTDGTVLGIVNNQQVNDQLCSLSLFGEDFIEYGQSFNGNLIQRLENFSNSIAPVNQLSGQLWYNSENSILYIYTENVWSQIYSESYFRKNIIPSTKLNDFDDLLQVYLNQSGFDSNGIIDSGSYIIIDPTLGGTGLVNALGIIDRDLNSIVTNLATMATTAYVGNTYAPINSPTFAGNAMSSGVEQSYYPMANNTNIVTTNFVFNAINENITNNFSGETIANAFSEYAPINSPNLTGTPTASTPNAGDNSNKISTTAFVDNAITTSLPAYLTIAAAQNEYAPINSPNLIGTPTVPTPNSGDNSNKISTTAFVDNAIASLFNNYLTVSAAQREYAPINSPNLTGTPTAPTPNASDNSTKISTTAFVDNAFAFLMSGVLTISEAAQTYAPIQSANFTGTPTLANFPNQNQPSNFPSTTSYAAGTFNLNNAGGSVMFPSGLMLQWGNLLINNSETTLNFNTSFPNTCLMVFVENYVSGNIQNQVLMAAQPNGNSSATVVAISTGSSPSVQNIYTNWFAIGK